MQNLPNKAKQLLTLLLKLLVVGGAFYFIYERLANSTELNWSQFQKLVLEKTSVWSILFVLFLSFLNRFLEILKWQNLVKSIKLITISEATQQVLGSLTLALFTPNGIGEYAGKALFFEKIKTKKIIFLNLICNGIQLILTIILGTLGLIIFNLKFHFVSNASLLLISGITFTIILVLFLFKKITVRGYSIEKLIQKINAIPKSIHQKNIALGILRYLTFSHQYYFLFLLFGVNQGYVLLMSAITCVYFLASALPSIQFLDFAVKGSVAVYFFGLLGVNEWITVFITTLMWFLNTVIPVVMGSYYVLNFKSQWKS